MPSLVRAYQPTFTAEQVALCQQTVRQHTAPQAQVYRAKLALLLHATPALDNVAAGRQLGKHENWVRSWRRIWVRAGFRLPDKPGRGRKSTFPPSPWRRSRRWPARCPRSAPSRSAATARAILPGW